MSGFAMEGTATFEPQVQPATKPSQPSRVILLVEGTAAAATNNKTARKWIDVLLKKIDADARGADSAVSQGTGATQSADDMPRMQYSLIVYGTWDRSTQAPIQFSSWCSSLTELLEWLNGVQFVGGGPSKGYALTEALAQAIIMSKYPYPDGSRPAAAGASHPQPATAQDSSLTAHTHVWVVCSSFSPCRLPIPWACEADTKAALSATFYPAFIERFDSMIQQLRVSSSQTGSSSVFQNFDSIKQSLQPPITPGTADIWDLTFSLARHRLSLSILSGMHKHNSRTPSGEQYRSCVEFFCYANACLSISQLKQACRIGLMGWQVAQAALLMSPLHIEASKAGLQYVSKLLSAQTARRQQQQQQQQQATQASQADQQPSQQQQQPVVGTPPQQGFPAAGAQQAAVPAQQQQQPQQQPQAQGQGQPQLTAQQQQQLAMAQRQQAQQQAQQPQQQTQQQQMQQAQQMQMRQQQQAQSQGQQHPQQQQWMQAAQAAAGRPVSAQQAMQQQQQQQQQAAQAAASRQQQQQAQQVQQQQGQMGVAGPQVQAGMVPQHQAMLLQQQAQKQQQQGMQSQQQAQQQQQMQAAQQAMRYNIVSGQLPAGTVVMGGGPQQPQQQLAGMGGQMVSQGQVFVQAQPQQMMLQQQQPMAMGGYMQPQVMPAMQQQMLGVQVNMPQQQQQQPQMQMQAQAGGGASGGAGRQRSAFWSGMLYIDQPGVPGQGFQRMPVANIELLASNAPVMGAQFANRGNQIVSSRMLTLPEFKQQTSVRGPTLKVTRGSYKILAQQALWNWLQGQVQMKPDKQVILEGQIQGITTIFVFGNQEMRSQPPTAPLNMMEGTVIYICPV